MKIQNMRFKTLYKILNNINEDRDIIAIARACDMTYSYAHNVILQFEKLGLIETHKPGRSRNIKITKKGAIAIDCAKTLMKLVGD